MCAVLSWRSSLIYVALDIYLLSIVDQHFAITTAEFLPKLRIISDRPSPIFGLKDLCAESVISDGSHVA